MKKIITPFLLTVAITPVASGLTREEVTTGVTATTLQRNAITITTSTLPSSGTTILSRASVDTTEARHRLKIEMETQRRRHLDKNYAAKTVTEIKGQALHREQTEKEYRDNLHSRPRGTTTGPALWTPNPK